MVPYYGHLSGNNFAMRKASRTPSAMPVQQISVTPVEWGKDVQHNMDDTPEWRVNLIITSFRDFRKHHFANFFVPIDYDCFAIFRRQFWHCLEETQFLLSAVCPKLQHYRTAMTFAGIIIHPFHVHHIK